MTLWGEGRWSVDVRRDELADLRCDGDLVLRGLRAVARDEDWATARTEVVGRELHDDGLTLHLRIRDLNLDLAGTLRLTVDGSRLAVDLDLEARDDSPTNRTGLVVLHPPALAGAALRVVHPDGTSTDTAFPEHLSPHQPARDVAGLRWQQDGLPLRLDLEGDVFEMEDQRNWTDASYKTYSRPLDLPFPYRLPRGERVRQRLVLTAGAAIEELRIDAGGPAPEIGTGFLDLELADPGWPGRLDAALAAHARLALWVVSPSPADPAALAELASRLDGAALRWIGIVDAVRHVTTPELAGALRAVLPPDVPVVAGARSHFTELNREWETVLAARPAGLAFATTPLFHARDTAQLVESVAMQRLIAHEATHRAPDLPVHVGPITLRPRFANVATRPQPVPAPTPAPDPRAGSALHEAWTVASAAALSVPGVGSLTDELLPSPLAGLTGPLTTGHSADGLVWMVADDTTRLLANLSDRPRRLRLPGLPDPVDLDPVSWRTA